MALADKDILITPNRGQSNDPKIEFKGADASSGPNTITLNVYPTDNGTLSFEGSAGQLFSITNSLTGTIFSVNDVSGIPSIEVLDTGLVKLAQYSGNVLLGTATDNGTDKLQVNGSVSADVIKSTIATGTAPLTVASTTAVTNLNADLLDGNHASAFLSSSTTSTQGGYFGNIYLYDDTNPSHYLAITNASDLSAARTLSVNVNNEDRTISLSGNLTVSAAATVSGTNTGDQTSVTGSAGSVANAVTFNNGGSGAASGTTYNGSAARTISYNTVGAASSGHGHYIGTTAVQASSANQAVTGITSITGGTGTTDISLLSANTTAAASGAITVSTGTTTTSGTTGAVTISSGNSAAASGNTVIKTGTAAGAVSSGNISLSTGNATSTNGTAGEISIVAGDSNTTTVSYTGEIYISGGNNTNTAGGTRGSVTIKGGNSSSTSANATGSDVYIYGGLATSTASVVKASGNVYIDGGGIGANGTRNFGSIYIGTQANATDYGTTHVTIGKSGTEVRLPGVGTSTAFVKIGANGALSSDTNTYSLSNHNHTYDVNNVWLSENGDNAHFKIYGNSRQVTFRTDGTTEYSTGVGASAFVWMYGGDAVGNKVMSLASDGYLTATGYKTANWTILQNASGDLEFNYA